jgi:hypothetical protein
MNDVKLTTTTGMYGTQWAFHPSAAHAATKILAMEAKGRESMRKRTNGHKRCLITKPTRIENLALTVEALGWENAREYIAFVYHRIGWCDDAANTLHIPEAAVRAVVMGTFPTIQGEL